MVSISVLHVHVCAPDLFMTLLFYPYEFSAAADTVASYHPFIAAPDLAIIYLLKFKNLSKTQEDYTL